MDNTEQVGNSEVRTFEMYNEQFKSQKKWSDEKKRQVLADWTNGRSAKSVAWVHSIPVNYLYRWKKEVKNG
jgi:transposase-like protein